MANIITLARYPLIIIYLIVLYYGNSTTLLLNTPLIILIFLLDTLDGWIARKRGETSLLGSVLDIATDRTMEYVLWVVYAHLNLIPVVVPIIVIIRGTMVDAVRSIGMKSGTTAFEQIQSPINRFLVSSRFMRAFYGTVKAIAAGLLTLAFGLISLNSPWSVLVYRSGLLITWISVLTCVIRGVPVLIEGYRAISKEYSTAN